MVGLAGHAEVLGQVATRDGDDVEAGHVRISSSASTPASDSISTTFSTASLAAFR